MAGLARAPVRGCEDEVVRLVALRASRAAVKLVLRRSDLMAAAAFLRRVMRMGARGMWVVATDAGCRAGTGRMVRMDP